jgi:hypothetical protein
LLAVLVCFACASPHEVGELTQARRHLKTVPCGATLAVNGVAGVNEDPHLVYLGDWVVVSVCHLDELVKKAEAAQQPISLFIEGLESENEPVGMDLENGTLTFILYRNVKNKELWRQFLYDPLFDPYATIRVSVGVHGDRPLPRAEGANLSLRVQKLYVDSWTYLWAALLLAVAIVLLIAANRSDMLRDGPSVGNLRQPYSLARSQMAWWFFLILFAYVYIWLVTGDRDSIPPSLLGLFGISAATALAAVAVSHRSRQATQQKCVDEAIEHVDVALQRIAIDLNETTDATLRASLEKKRAELEAQRAKLVLERASVAAVAKSAGFWNDLVTDDRGAVALDRLQVVVWTIVLGGVFLSSVVWDLTMPELNGTLLALMGISSGTYIGFKLPLRSQES